MRSRAGAVLLLTLAGCAGLPRQDPAWYRCDYERPAAVVNPLTGYIVGYRAPPPLPPDCPPAWWRARRMTRAVVEDALAWLRADDIGMGEDLRRRMSLDRHAAIFSQVFGDPAGQAVLQVILEASLFRSPVDHRLEGEAYLRYAQLREGQNQLAAMILAYLEHFEKEKAHGRPGSPDGSDASGGPGEPDATGDAAGGWGALAIR